MRELKFRAWSKLHQKWYTNTILLACMDGLPFAHFVEVDDNQEVVKHHFYNAEGLDLEIQQFTGVKDIYGNDIYEGDILEYGKERGLVHFNSWNYAEMPAWNLLLYQSIPFGQEDWKYTEKCEETGELPAIEYYYGCGPDKHWKIVGNIFEGLKCQEENSTGESPSPQK